MTPKLRQWRRFGVFIVNFEHISHLYSSVFIANFEHVTAGWEKKTKIEPLNSARFPSFSITNPWENPLRLQVAF